MAKSRIVDFAPEAREAAARELMDLANRMMTGGRSFMKMAMRLQHPDPKVRYRVISIMRNYQASAMPATEEMDRIEALLRGVPFEACLSEANRRRKEKRAKEVQQEKRRQEYQDEQYYEFLAWKRAQKADQAPRRTAVSEDGVIVGPWGGGSA